MKFVFTFVAALLMFQAEAQSLSGIDEEEPELFYHAAAPGMTVMPRIDMSQMIIVYDVTLILREGKGMVRWGKLNENGEGEGYWTRWRDYDDVLTFTTPGRYVFEAHTEADGIENSCPIRATFKVDYIGMTMAPGIMIMPYGQRGYEVSLTSIYNDPVYYRWKYYDSLTWNGWKLYTDIIPFTEVGEYVLDARCENDPLSVFMEVPSVEYQLTGDVDLNGTVDISDATALINMLLNGTTTATGDVNNDGTVDITDATLLIEMLLGLQ